MRVRSVMLETLWRMYEESSGASAPGNTFDGFLGELLENVAAEYRVKHPPKDWNPMQTWTPAARAQHLADVAARNEKEKPPRFRNRDYHHLREAIVALQK